MSDPFAQGADDYLNAAGSVGTYHGLDGDVTLDGVTNPRIVIERDVEVVDDGGLYVRRAMATFKSGLVKPHTNDWIEIGSDRWSIEAPESDDGYLQRVFVRPML